MSASSTISAARHRLLTRCQRVTLGLALLLAAIFALAMVLGDYPVPVPEILRALFSPLTGHADPGVDFIILTVRLPRAVAAVLTGAAFGLAGVIFQTVLRNPLASPDIIGISHGASAAAVICVIALKWSAFAVAGGAFAGALATAFAIYGLGWRGGGSPYRMVLIGIGMAAMLGAVISFLFTRARVEDVQRALVWIVGSLNAVGFAQILPLAVALLVLLPALALIHRALAGLQLGDDAARSIGIRADRTRLAAMVIAVALAAVATAVSGPVGFVAFLAGPIARRLLGPAAGALVPSLLTGALVMLGADIVAQHCVGASQLPVGVVTGAFGAAFLLYLLATANRGGRGA